MNASDFRPGPCRLMHSATRLDLLHRVGSPRFLGMSFRARRSQSPRFAEPLQTLVASGSISGFTNSGRLAANIGVTRPKRICFRCGSRVRLPGLRTDGSLRRTPGSLHVERAINMVELSSTRHARLVLAHRRALSRTEGLRFAGRLGDAVRSRLSAASADATQSGTRSTPFAIATRRQCHTERSPVTAP